MVVGAEEGPAVLVSGCTDAGDDGLEVVPPAIGIGVAGEADDTDVESSDVPFSVVELTVAGGVTDADKLSCVMCTGHNSTRASGRSQLNNSLLPFLFISHAMFPTQQAHGMEQKGVRCA
eukprot:scpid26231/ scgid19112/ 